MGLLAKAILCFLLIHLSLSSGSGYEQGNENNVERGGMIVRIDRRLSRGGGSGGSSGGGRSSSSSNNGRSGSGASTKKTPNTSTGNNKKNNNGGGRAPRRVPVTAPRRVPISGGTYGAGEAASHNNNNNHHSVGVAAPLGCKRSNFCLLAAAIVAILLAAEC